MGFSDVCDTLKQKAGNVAKELSDHALTKSHARHLSLDKCMEIGLNVTPLEEGSTLQDAVLSVHHAFIHTLSGTIAYKIIENQLGTAYIQLAQQIVMKR